MSKRAAKTKRPRGRRRKPRARRARLLLAVASCLLAASLVGVLALYVTVTHRFDGRLWKLPSRIYSDLLVLGPGAPMTPERLAARLDRCGYARTAELPTRPGQYRRRGSSIDLYRRAFATPTAEVEAERFHLRFAGDRVASIRDAARLQTLHDVPMDGTYTAKALHGMLQFIESRQSGAGTHLYWHTYQRAAAVLDGDPQVPAGLQHWLDCPAQPLDAELDVL